VCPACDADHELDEDTCVCLCPAPTACCVCANDEFEAVACATAVPNGPACDTFCAGAGGHLSSFASPALGSSFVCEADFQCSFTCQPERPTVSTATAAISAERHAGDRDGGKKRGGKRRRANHGRHNH
jgi:hypothetical protein